MNIFKQCRIEDILAVIIGDLEDILTIGIFTDNAGIPDIPDITDIRAGALEDAVLNCHLTGFFN